MKEVSTKFEIIKFFLRNYLKISVILIFSFIIIALLESIGIISLLALLGLFFENATHKSSFLYEKLNLFFNYFSVDVTLLSILTFIIILILSKNFISFFAFRYISVVTHRFAMNFRKNLMQNMIASKWQYLSSKPLGSYFGLLNVNAPNSASIFINVNRLIASTINVFIFLIFSFFISPVGTLFGLFIGLIIFLLLNKIIVFGEINARGINSQINLVNSKISDYLKGIKFLKGMALDNYLINQFSNDFENLRKYETNLAISKFLLAIIREPIIVIFLCLLIFTYNQILGVAMASVLVIAIFFYRILNNITVIQQNYFAISVNTDFFRTIHSTTKEAYNKRELTSGGKSLSNFKSLQFKNLSFSFANKTILENVNFLLKKNSITLLYGRSGIGKTTVLDILVGFQKPNEGFILLNNKDLALYNILSFRKKISYVTQDQFIFNQSILHNITLGKKFLKKDVNMAIKNSDSYDFINKLPKGFNTLLGEGGVQLSGGQKQRLILARAIIQKPELLILDEPTTGVDSQNKRIILETLKKLSKKITIIIVSHDNSISKHSDNIYKLSSKKLNKLK